MSNVDITLLKNRLTEVKKSLENYRALDVAFKDSFVRYTMSSLEEEIEELESMIKFEEEKAPGRSLGRHDPNNPVCMCDRCQDEMEGY